MLQRIAGDLPGTQRSGCEEQKRSIKSFPMGTHSNQQYEKEDYRITSSCEGGVYAKLPQRVLLQVQQKKTRNKPV